MHLSLSFKPIRFFFVRHIDRLKVMLHTKLARRECFRKKLMIKPFFFVYASIHAYTYATITLSPEKKPSLTQRVTRILCGNHA